MTSVQHRFIAGCIVLLIAITSCVPDPSSEYGQADLVTMFEPDRGKGSEYYVGEELHFRIRSKADGWITLTAIDPDGTVYEVTRNIRVYKDSTTLTPPYGLVPPTGLHRVRATFTPNRTSGHVVYDDLRGEEVWSRRIYTEIESYEDNERDVEETYFYLY